MREGGLVAFLAMGGYGFYVWTSYVTVAIAIVIEIFAVRARARAAVKSASGPGRTLALPDDVQ